MQLSSLSESDIVFRSIQLPKRGALLPLPRYSPEKLERRGEAGSQLMSSSSCSAYKPLESIAHRRKPSLSRSTHSHPPEPDCVPTPAKPFHEMVNKKRSLLRIKHKIQGAGDCIPNILEIGESVKQEEVSFLRRMDAKLNTDGNANLLVNLKRDLRIRSQNYLREMSQKERRHLASLRRKSVKGRPGARKEQYIGLQCCPAGLWGVGVGAQ